MHQRLWPTAPERETLNLSVATLKVLLASWQDHFRSHPTLRAPRPATSLPTVTQQSCHRVGDVQAALSWRRGRTSSPNLFETHTLCAALDHSLGSGGPTIRRASTEPPQCKSLDFFVNEHSPGRLHAPSRRCLCQR